MAGDKLTVCEQELLYAFARLVSISSNFLFFLGVLNDTNHNSSSLLNKIFVCATVLQSQSVPTDWIYLPSELAYYLLCTK